MMKRMSFSETIFLFVLALVIFGPKKLPEIARQVGKALNEFRRASNEFKAQIEQEIAHLEVKDQVQDRQTILPPSPPVEGTTSRTETVLAATSPVDVSATAEKNEAGVEAQSAEVTNPAPVASDDEAHPNRSAQETNHASTAEPVDTEAVTSPSAQESHV